MIEETPDQELMNSKSEFGANSVHRVVIEDDRPTTSTSSSIKRFPSDNPEPGVSNNKRRRTQRTDTEIDVQTKVLPTKNDRPKTFSQLISIFCKKSDSSVRNMNARNLPPDLECSELVLSRNSAPEFDSTSVPNHRISQRKRKDIMR